MYPTTVFPLEIDSDKTLFKVLNSTQSYLYKEINKTDTVIEIFPVSPESLDVWPESGFVKIENELIYYDSVEKNLYGKIYKLVNCIRGIESKAEFHNKSKAIYGTVVAQHHNQLVNAIINLENIIGDIQENLNVKQSKNSTQSFNMFDYNSKNSMSMNFSLANLSIYPPIGDDACPDVEFIFNIIEESPNVIAEFCVRIFGNYLTYKLDFGNGSYTTTEFSGTYTYSIGDVVNPVVTVTSENCCITQQPVSNPGCCDFEPMPNPSVAFSVLIPDVPDFPSFTVPESTRNCPGPVFDLPPILIPQLSASSNVSPSDISITGCNIPSEISIISCCNFPSQISIIGCCDIPSIISLITPSTITVDIISFEPISVIGYGLPTEISIVGCDIPSIITFANAPVFAPIQFATPPLISVYWGVPPTVSCIVQVQCPSSSPAPAFAATNFNMDSFAPEIPVEISAGDIGIPKEIKLIVPKIHDIKLIHNIPENINLNVPEIRINANDIPRTIEVINDIPSLIRLDSSSLPNTIEVVPGKDFPKFLEVRGIPNHLEVVGIPSTIEVKTEVKLVMPEDPTIELVYKGSPIELNINVDISKNLSEIILSKSNI